MTDYIPQTAGFGQEPAVSVASMIRATITGAPFIWPWNRNENNSIILAEGTQDYTLNVTDFGFIEKASLTDSTGMIYELKDVLNIAPLAVASTPTDRPSAISALIGVPYQSVKLRFSPVPDAEYTLNLTYQKSVSLLGPYFIDYCGNASYGETTYYGTFDTISFPEDATASVTGFVTNADNNGQFTVVSCTTTELVLDNADGVAEAPTNGAFVSNFNWSPIPDSFMYVYNFMYLGEILALSDDSRAQIYRQRGVASLLSKAEGLSETQKNAFMQLWMARTAEQASMGLRVQQGVQGRGL